MTPERFGPYLTRRQALALNAAWFVGKACKKGHRPYRYRNAGCIQCSRDAASLVAWLRPNTPRPLLTDAEREVRRIESAARFNASEKRRQIEARKNASPKVKARKQAWIEANRDRIAASRKARHAARPELATTRRRRRRARLKGAIGYFTADQVQAILWLQLGRCAYCGDTGPLHLDHKRALARGGSNWPENLQWLCQWHNTSKGATSDPDYRRRKGIPRLTPWDAETMLWRVALLD